MKPRPALRLPVATLLLAFGAAAHADLAAPDRFTPAATPRLGELRWAIQAPGDHRLVLGAALQHPGLAAPAAPPVAGWRVGLWVQDEWRLADALDATSGVRMDRDDAGLSRPSPRAALRWRAGGGLELRAELERADRLPWAFDVVDETMPAPTGPPAATTRLVGEQRLPGDWLLRATASRVRWRDAAVVGVDPASGLTQLDGSGSGGTVRGAALALGRRWPGGSRVEARLALQTLDNADGRTVPEGTRGQGRLAVELPVGAMQVGARWVAESARPGWDGSHRAGSGRLDLSLQTGPPGPRPCLSVAVANVGDAGGAERRQVQIDARLPF